MSEVSCVSSVIENLSLFGSSGVSVSDFGPCRKRMRSHVVNRHLGPLESEDFSPIINDTVMVDDGGYIDKTTQLSILQKAGSQLDQYYRSVYPSVYLQKGEEPESDDSLSPMPFGMDEMEAIDLQRDLDRRAKSAVQDYFDLQASALAQKEETQKQGAADSAGGSNSGS